MKTLLLMRHATAAEKIMNQTDFEKELTLVGEREAGQAGLWLKAHQLAPQQIICSSAARTQATCQAVVEVIGKNVSVHLEKSIYTGTEKDLYYLVQDADDALDFLLVIGHNPTISFFASQVTHQDLSFSPANVAAISLPIASWLEIKTVVGKLTHFYRT